jgi:hypothetical protein
MSAEFYITFNDSLWLHDNKRSFEEYIYKLETFSKIMDNEYWFKEKCNSNPYYDVRLIVKKDNNILLEISFHPDSIENDLKKIFLWMRNQTQIDIKDEDGEISGW